MAVLTALSARLTFKVDSGEVKDGKPVFINSNLSNIDGSASANAFGAVATALSGFFENSVGEVRLNRIDILA
jgi:hypothetical protein